MARRANLQKIAEPQFPKVIETFRDISEYTLSELRHSEPSCFNGIVSVRKYRITVEEIDEPNDVIVERLKKLWAESENYHHYTPLKTVAKKYGLDLSEGFGKDAPRNRK